MNLWRKLVLFGAVAAAMCLVDAAVANADQYIDYGISRPARVRPARQTPPVTVVHFATKLGLGATRCTSRPPVWLVRGEPFEGNAHADDAGSASPAFRLGQSLNGGSYRDHVLYAYGLLL
jgi:hypothetical protein